MELNLLHSPQRACETATPRSRSNHRAVVAGRACHGLQRCACDNRGIQRFRMFFCRRFHDQVLPSLKRDYIDTGLVRFIHKDLPLPFHRQARPAAAAAVAPLNRTATGTCTAHFSINRPASNARASSESLKPSTSTPQSFKLACKKAQLRESSKPIFLRPNCTTSVPRRLSSLGLVAVTKNTTATLLKGLYPGLNSRT